MTCQETLQFARRWCALDLLGYEETNSAHVLHGGKAVHSLRQAERCHWRDAHFTPCTVQSWSPLILTTATLRLESAAPLAAVVPSQKAASIEPMQALRNE
jgi:hypothetical protein